MAGREHCLRTTLYVQSAGEAENDLYEVISGWRATGAPAAMAIDEALQFLGIEAVGDLDEFDTVGLGAHRITEQW